MLENKKIAIIGLGYVGLPLAVEFGKKYSTIGFDTNIGRIDELISGLDPNPTAKKNEILAWTGGTFYSRETPEAEEYVLEGQHVEKGDVVGILEVMKMFNQIRAEFSGTIRKICVSAGSGIIVSRGQQLFEIDPDEPSVSENEEDKFIMQKEYTIKIMKRILPLN